MALTVLIHLIGRVRLAIILIYNCISISKSLIKQIWKYVDDTTLSETVVVNKQSVLQSLLDGISSWCEENVWS